MRTFVAVVLLAWPGPSAVGQAWDTEAARRMAATVASRREIGGAFSDYRAHGRGFVLFLGQFGEGLSSPPELLQVDQVALEVYWQAPNRSKQRIVGRRDRVAVPTGIAYHADHLGIVQRNFPDRIRLGECAEICDVPHPFSRTGLDRYRFAMGDSVRMVLPGVPEAIHAIELLIRPGDETAPGVVGSVVADAASGQILQVRWSFTAASYEDPSLEDVSLFLDNALWEGRHWLPRFQQVDVRRRTAWLDFPARGIIRTTVEVDRYEFDVGLRAEVFRGAAISQAPREVREAHAWDESLDDALRRNAITTTSLRLAEVREVVGRIAARRALDGLAGRARIGAGSLSEIARVNRVEGLSVGAGGSINRGAWMLRGWGGFGFSDHRFKARVVARRVWSQTAVTATAERRIQDVSDRPVTAPVVGSLVAQEAGIDYGDYYLVEGIGGTVERWRGGSRITLGLDVDRIRSVATVATPAAGEFRPNPAFQDGRYLRTWLGARHDLGNAPTGSSGLIETRIEIGRGTETYVRATGLVRGELAAGPGRWAARGWAGVATSALPAHRSFVLGGRGTLVGEPFRAFGGRTAFLGRVGWSVEVPVPSVPLGSFLSTGDHLTVGPTVQVGWAGGELAGMPWGPSDGVRPVIGGSIGLLHDLLQIDLGYATRTGALGLTVDIRPSLWPIL